MCNKVSRGAHIHGAGRVEMRGKSIVRAGAVIRGDYGSPVRVGRYCVVGSNSILRPPPVPMPDGQTVEYTVPLVIGSHTSIGQNCVVESAYVGSYVTVGRNCVLGPRSVIKDCAVIRDGTVLGSDGVIPPFAIVGGRPGLIGGDTGESRGVEVEGNRVKGFARFVERRRKEEERTMAVEAKTAG